jgi:DNA repair exonuclease SbcCD ATPase subunit
MNDINNSDLKTDIALIKRDISQIEKMLGKLDLTVDKIAGISKTLAIQERIVENHEKRLNEIDEKISIHHKEEEQFRKHLQTQLELINSSNRQYIEEVKIINSTEREKRHKEVMESIELIRKELKEKNQEQDARLSKLEQWKWWVMGAAAAVTTIGSMAWKTFFG